MYNHRIAFWNCLIAATCSVSNSDIAQLLSGVSAAGAD